MKKNFRVFATWFAVVMAIVLLLIKFFRRGREKIQNSSRKTSYNVMDSMRNIENLFEEEVQELGRTRQTIVVKNKDFKKWNVYKYDILTIIVVAIVIVMVIILSVLSFDSQQKHDEIMRAESKDIEVAKRQILENIENNSMTFSKMADSVDLHLKQGMSSLKEIAITLQKIQKKGDKK